MANGPNAGAANSSLSESEALQTTRTGGRLYPMNSGYSMLLTAVSPVWLLVACGPSEREDSLMAPGDPEISLGFSDSEGSYQALRDGDSAPVIWGLQGGTWTMPILRTRGIASPTNLSASLTQRDGEHLGSWEVVETSFQLTQGWLQTSQFRLPVQHAPPFEYESVEDLYGASATIEVHAWDAEERAADLRVEVVLVEGP